jgi:integrase
MTKFTKRSVATLAPPVGKDDHIEWDPELPGFGIRFRATKKSWICQYRIGTQQRRESLGDVRKVDLDSARKIARKRFASVELGIDPKVVTLKGAVDAAAMKRTLAVVVERFLEFKQPTWRPASYEAARRYLTVHWGPLAGRPLASIQRADVADRIGEIIKANGRVAAAQARGYLVALFSWAIKEGLVETNAAASTNDPGVAKPRDRVLNNGELKAIWNAANDVGGDFGKIVRLLLLTAQRRCEIAHLRRQEIDPDAATITLPPERVKNGYAHVVPLSEPALAILRPRLNADGLIFGNGGPFRSWSNAKANLDAAIAKSGSVIAPWTLHDLRRSCATRMANDLDIEPHIIEAVLNHYSGHRRGDSGTYNRARYARQMRTALELWGAHLLALVEGRKLKVVQLRGA